MKMRLFPGAVCALVMSVSVAAAPAAFDRHIYAFVGAGRADTEAEFSVADRIDGDDTSFEIGVGYAFTPYLSIEGSYQDFGKPDGFVGCPVDVLCIAVVPLSREAVSVDAWSAALRGDVPLYGRVSAYARLGVLAWETSARTPALDDSGSDLLYGLGLRGQLTDYLDVQLGYEKTDLDIDSVRLALVLRLTK